MWSELWNSLRSSQMFLMQVRWNTFKVKNEVEDSFGKGLYILNMFIARLLFGDISGDTEEDGWINCN